MLTGGDISASSLAPADERGLESGKEFFVIYWIVALVILLVIEVGLEQQVIRQAKRTDTGMGPKDVPYYSWAYYTQSGVRFGFWRGFLKLQMSPNLVYRNFPNQQTPYFQTNSRGFRGVELKTIKEKKRLVLLGGSTAFGTGMRSDAETAAAHLAQLLNVEIANAAVIGHRSGQELAFISSELLDLQPDLIVALSGWNDFSQYWLSPMKHDPLGFAAFELIDGKVEESQRLLGATLPQRVLQLPRLLFPVLERKLKVAWAKLKKTKASGLEGVDWKIPKLAASFVRNVEIMSALTNARGVKFAGFLQPVRQNAEGALGEILPHYAEFRRIAMELFKERGLVIVDLNDKTLGDELFFDLTHLTAEGQKVLATKVAALLHEGRYL